jgi:SAM-dependent methyltransferase
MIAVSSFEENYLAAREKENRLYTDEQVKRLPFIEETHPHYKEWLIRQNSLAKLSQHLSLKKRKLDILEVGCGNGWLSHHLSKITGSYVTGIDINKIEIDQANRVFARTENLKFFFGEITDEIIRQKKFDTMVFAASIQYFPSLNEIIPASLQLLKKEGEIHIIDSHFYKRHELEAARLRTYEYYHSLQMPQMTKHYFHHCVDELKPFHHKILYNPHSLINKLATKNPFPWICIYHYA